jgi:hypothetical protein
MTRLMERLHAPLLSVGGTPSRNFFFGNKETKTEIQVLPKVGSRWRIASSSTISTATVEQ